MKKDKIASFYRYRGAANREADGSLVITYMREKNFLGIDEFFCTAKSENKLMNLDLAITVIIRLFETLFALYEDERFSKILQEFIKNMEVIKNEVLEKDRC